MFANRSGLPLTPRQDLEQSSLLFLGGMIQMLLLILAWPLDRSAIERIQDWNEFHLHLEEPKLREAVIASNWGERAPLTPEYKAIHAANLALPNAGFTIAGLTLTSLQGNTISVPDAKLDSAQIGRLHGSPVSVPTFGLTNLNLPSAQIPSVTSSAPLDVPADLQDLRQPPFRDP